jgi:hypothetical protein
MPLQKRKRLIISIRPTISKNKGEIKNISWLS